MFHAVQAFDRLFNSHKSHFDIHRHGGRAKGLIQQGNTGGNQVASKRSIRLRNAQPGEEIFMGKSNNTLCQHIGHIDEFLELDHPRSIGLGLQFGAKPSCEQEDGLVDQESQCIKG